MTWFNVLQSAFAAGVIALVVERSRALLLRAPLDEGPFRRRLVELLAAGDRARASELVRAALPSVVAVCVWPLLDPSVAESDRLVDSEDRLLVEQARVERGLRALRVGATVGSALGFLGAALEIHWIFAGSHGILRLQAGLVESLAFDRALLALGIGLGTSSLALGTSMVFRRAASRVVAEARRSMSAVHLALREPGPGASAGDSLTRHREPLPSDGV